MVKKYRENNTNFLRETIEELEIHGKTPKDVKVVYVYPYWHWDRKKDPRWQKGTWEDFARLADQPRQMGWNDCQEGIYDGLLIVGEDWWLERDCNDEFGTEWWAFKTLPFPPGETKPLEPFIRYDREDDLDRDDEETMKEVSKERHG